MAKGDAQQYGKKTGKFDARLVLGVIVAVLIGVFIVQNREDVPLTIFFFEVSMPLWIGLLITVLLSAAVGFLLGRGRYKH